MVFLARSRNKVTINHITLPREFFAVYNIIPENYNYSDCFFVKINAFPFFESFKLMEPGKMLIFKIEEEKITFYQNYPEEKLGYMTKKETVVNILLDDEEENDFPSFKEERILEFKILNVILIIFF